MSDPTYNLSPDLSGAASTTTSSPACGPRTLRSNFVGGITSMPVRRRSAA
jgi:hypothetical protein